MCILHGMYWPRLDSTTELCAGGTSSVGTPISLTAPDLDDAAAAP
jgi:hypothetical protein